MICINDFSRKFEMDLYSLCERSPYGARIISYHAAYHGKKYNFLDFWIQRDKNNKAVCAFCKYYSTVIICGQPSEKSEAEDFIRMLSPVNILCDDSLKLDLGMKVEKGETMECTELSEMSSGANIKIIRLSSDMENLKSVYLLICEESGNKTSMPDFESYFLDISHKMRHGFSEVYAVCDEEGNIVSTAAVLAVSQFSCVIGCVATSPKFRKRGYATALVRYITEKKLKTGRIVYLHREKYISIYEKTGFKTVGLWNELTRCDNG